MSTYLLLWVDHERPPPAPGHQDGILGGDGVPGQPEGVPLPDLVGVCQHLDQTDVLGHRDL